MNTQDKTKQNKNSQPRGTNETARTEDMTKGTKFRVLACDGFSNQEKINK